jgi:hypothetical protein
MQVEEKVTVLTATVNVKQIRWFYQQSMTLQCQQNLVPFDSLTTVIWQLSTKHKSGTFRADGGINVNDMQLNPPG